MVGIQLVLMVGGKGTRMGEITKNVPKPMLTLNNKPLLEYTIEWAKKNGVTNILICTGHLSKVIEDYFGDGSNWGISIKYSIEKEPLGTGGPLKLAEELLEEDFILLNGDIMCEVDFKKAFEFHKVKNSDVSIVIHETDHALDSDLIETDTENRIKKFWLRPHTQAIPKKPKSNAGMYILNKKILKHIALEKVSLEKTIFPLLFANNYSMYGYNSQEFLRDMGTPERMKQLEEKMQKGEKLEYGDFIKCP